jgi:hypothetical protein
MRFYVLALVALAACGGSTSDTTLHISNYETTCAVASDCAVVFIGDPCASACRCPNAAISTTATIQEASDLAAAEALCTTSPGGCTVSCVVPTASCAQGVCALQ